MVLMDVVVVFFFRKILRRFLKRSDDDDDDDNENGGSDSHLHGDFRVWFVILQNQVFEFEVVDGLDFSGEV